MNKKLEDYKIKVAIKEINEETEKACARGFDAAIALELPIRFAEWKFQNTHPVKIKDGSISFVITKDKTEYITAQDLSDMTKYTDKELYVYWIENIFKIE